MKDGGETEQRMTVTQQGLLPVRVSRGAFFHVRYGGKTGDGSEECAFIAHTFASVRALLLQANCANPDVYLCSKVVGGGMAVRRVTLIRKLPHTDLCFFELEDGRGVLWDEAGYFGAVSAYLDVDAPQDVSQLTTIAAREAGTGSVEQKTNHGARAVADVPRRL
ncbi:hypothetical protein OKW40_003632 [Paraburkholderia sp. RAU6.4a]|uniref:hypothetical protein n=1 Tax=Paraburkholderia sp. RAU6.4a TaxID=2991067 RepID=UPI003D214D41